MRPQLSGSIMAEWCLLFKQVFLWRKDVAGDDVTFPNYEDGADSDNCNFSWGMKQGLGGKKA